ncbi:NAD(P)H-binding protein [Kribbella sp. CA-247076]|uniref:NmrA family NAD(P)-binding protein n=1 Tax=Kribbella sp. CA-247076 TaxID=3239941 RepID=UPI003D8CD7E5
MNSHSTVLVIGATGRVGRHVVAGLRAAGVTVRALVRTPEVAGLPPDVELAQGDVYDPDAVRRAADGADAAFLLWPSFSADGAEPVVAALPKRVVYLSAVTTSGVWGHVEELLAKNGRDWTYLRPTGFAVNAQAWAEDFRTGDTVRLPFPEAGRSLIHERDIAAVAVLTLLDDRHVGETYVLTGPEVLTQAEQVQTIARAVGKPMRIEEQSPAEARQSMLDMGADPALADSSVTYWSSLADDPEPVTTTVPRLTGRPARTFAEWAEEHADEFRVLSTAEIADRYVAALSAGRVDDALALAAPDAVRVAPLETDGEEVELQGTEAVLENARRLSVDVEYLAVDLLGPFVLDDHFAVRFTFDQRNTRSGRRYRTTKLSLCTVADGRIVREEVFYYTPPNGN